MRDKVFLTVLFSFLLLAHGQEQNPPLPEDQTLVATPVSEEDIGYQKLKLLNSRIWFEKNFWEQSVEHLARSMNLFPESRTKYMSSYRSYEPTGLEIAGIKPFMVSVYGDPDHPREINLVFMNQGDFFGLIPNGPDKKKILSQKESDFKEQMKSQEKVLMETFSSQLGKPKPSSLGIGSLKERVYRWDIGDQSLLLCIQPDGYIAVRILPVSVADARGRPQDRVTDNELKTLLKSNVSKKANGDVVISQIPMIDQGPKGYCVPATYERILRYLGMSVDLYTLANSGMTQRGGGTYTVDMNQAVDDLLNRYGRKIQKNIPMKFNQITAWIDRGIPLIWALYVNDEIEAESKLFTRERSLQSPESWLATMKKYRLPKKIKLDNHAGHVRMIIGYNPLTEEICYTDSWGTEAMESWMPFDTAKAVSQNDDPLQAITW